MHSLFISACDDLVIVVGQFVYSHAGPTIPLSPLHPCQSPRRLVHNNRRTAVLYSPSRRWQIVTEHKSVSVARTTEASLCVGGRSETSAQWPSAVHARVRSLPPSAMRRTLQDTYHRLAEFKVVPPLSSLRSSHQRSLPWLSPARISNGSATPRSRQRQRCVTSDSTAYHG
jgi:hypothetical protein